MLFNRDEFHLHYGESEDTKNSRINGWKRTPYFEVTMSDDPAFSEHNRTVASLKKKKKWRAGFYEPSGQERQNR